MESSKVRDGDGMHTNVHESEANVAGTSTAFNISVVYKDETDAYKSYCAYAHDTGYSVRKDHHSYFPNSRKIKTKDFVCSKAGFKKSVYANSELKYRRAEVRTGCPSMVRFAVDEGGLWHVKNFIESHNHELARPTDRHLLRSCRLVDNTKASVLKSMTDAGIRTVDAYAYLAEEVGGIENVGFSKRDAYNFIQKEKRAKIEYGDTNSLIQIFKDRQVEDNMFAWDVQIDEFDRLVNFFWVDGIGRIDYDCFGDVLIFDTSYRLNKYNLVCAPFVGVNNHWQNILLGVAFLSDETIESFTWLFKTFLRIMGDKQPLTIFTDQDQAMARAIEVALPNTRHRLCQWHIYKKFPSKVPTFNSNNKVRGLFYKCLSKCDSVEEFEMAWSEMIKEGNLQKHDWLDDLYKIRNKWSTAYNKDCFSMGILSTQRSECTNNVCHGISKPTSSLTDCFLGLEKIMMTWRRNEQDEDFRCSQSEIVPVIKSSSILKQAAQFYLRKLFSLFQEEFLQGVGGLSIDFASSDSSKFLVNYTENKEHHNPWVVDFDFIEGNVQCSCRKFDTMGLLCSHCMRVLRQLDIAKIPEKYLMVRWSAKARKYIYSENLHYGRKNYKYEGGNGFIFRNHVSRFAFQISTRAQGNEEAEQYMLSAMKDIANNVDLLLDGKEKNNCKTRFEAGRSNLKDPVKRRPKGISNARLKAHWEKKKRPKKKPMVPDTSVVKDEAAPTPFMEETHFTQVHCPSFPECFNEEYISGQPTTEPGPEYTRLKMDFMTAEMEFNEFHRS